MTREELFLELCFEVIKRGIGTDRFTQLWLASGVNLSDSELEVINKFLVRNQEVMGGVSRNPENYH